MSHQDAAFCHLDHEMSDISVAERKFRRGDRARAAFAKLDAIITFGQIVELEIRSGNFRPGRKLFIAAVCRAEAVSV